MPKEATDGGNDGVIIDIDDEIPETPVPPPMVNPTQISIEMVTRVKIVATILSCCKECD